jgi:hypothetical protein
VDFIDGRRRKKGNTDNEEEKGKFNKTTRSTVVVLCTIERK